ncbi:hypothetical protein HAX54_001670, partial [Datura stramonium]|nr:hypothetical protein [Datura stramonium]
MAIPSAFITNKKSLEIRMKNSESVLLFPFDFVKVHHKRIGWWELVEGGSLACGNLSCGQLN